MAPTGAEGVPDLLDPAFYADPDAMHAALAELRRRHPVWRDEDNGLWAVLGHAAVHEVERRSDVFVSGRGYRSYCAPMEDNMIALDDPRHAEQRHLVASRFTPRAVRRLQPKLVALVDELIDGIAEAGEVDVVDALAAPLPSRLTTHLLGFPEDAWPDVRSWSERLMRYDRALADEQAGAGFVAAIMEFGARLGPLIDERRADPRDDLVSVWAHAEVQGCPMRPDTILNETGLFISGGAETTRTVISRGLVELSRHPDHWEAMAADPALIPDAVEEMIRWVTPLNNFFRTAAAPATLAGIDMAAGDRVVLLYPSANRDERVFPEPFRFDIARRPNPHLAFGFGTHFCLGASLARLELRLLMERLTVRLTAPQVVSAPDIEPNIFVSAVRSCRMAFEPR